MSTKKAFWVIGITLATIVAGTALSSNGGSASHPVTVSQAESFAAVRSVISLGMRKNMVRSLAGEPEYKQHREYLNYRGGTDTSDYWYYGDWQLAFDNNKLIAINRG